MSIIRARRNSTASASACRLGGLHPFTDQDKGFGVIWVGGGAQIIEFVEIRRIDMVAGDEGRDRKWSVSLRDRCINLVLKRMTKSPEATSKPFT